MVGQTKPGRDGLGTLFFAVHVAVLVYVLLGWLPMIRGWLIVYLLFLPAMVLHWKINGNACALNNLESWIRYRRWRAPEKNPEEGAWLRTLLARWTGLVLTKGQMDVVLYAALTLLWLVALVRFFKS